jgi:hypothetical protein
MDGILKRGCAAALLALAACGSQEPAENLEAKAQEMEGAAARAEDGAQAEVLENNADALRDAAEGEDKADTNGTVTVIEE